MNRRNFIRSMVAVPMVAVSGSVLAHGNCDIRSAPDEMEADLMLYTSLSEIQARRTAYVIYSLSH